MAVRPVPQGYHSITPYLIVRDAASAIAFYKKAFGAEELLRVPTPDGKIAHAEVRIGDSVVMLADEMMNNRSPRSFGGSPVGLTFYCPGVDAVYHRALQAGAASEAAPRDMFYGDRTARVEDPFGHRWTIATHFEDVSPEELDRRAKEMMSKKG